MWQYDDGKGRLKFQDELWKRMASSKQNEQKKRKQEINEENWSIKEINRRIDDIRFKIVKDRCENGRRTESFFCELILLAK